MQGGRTLRCREELGKGRSYAELLSEELIGWAASELILVDFCSDRINHRTEAGFHKLSLPLKTATR